MTHSFQRATTLLTLAIVSSFCMGVAQAQTSLPSDALVKALRQGGNVIVMRHAASPRTTPDKATANPDNVTQERQLDATGRATAKAMGQALRDLKIPIGDVLVSPAYRTRETANLAEFPNPKPALELGESVQNMQEASEAAAKWLQKQVTQFPSGTNTILVTHMPNLARAFPQQTSGMGDGEAFIFASDGKGGAALLARVKIEQWPGLAGK